MRTVNAIDRQTIVDVAVMYYGSTEALEDLCNDNGWELDHDLNAGDPILLQDTYPDSANSDVADYLQGNNVLVVSSGTNTQNGVLGTNDGAFIITNDGNNIGA